MGRGRNRKRAISPKGGFSRVDLDMQGSPAYRSLTATGLRLLIFCQFLNYNTATSRPDVDTSKPTFQLTNKTALARLGLSAPTFTRAKNELAEKGFLKWEKRGGLGGDNGIASEYSLSNEWRHWEPPRKATSNIEKAMAAKQSPYTRALTGTSTRALTGPI